MIRAEARRLLWQWREVAAAACIAALGFFWAVAATGPVLAVIGWTLVAAGGLLAAAGVQRARFRVGSDGPGVVQIVEKRISYFGPLDGGVVDLESLSSVVLDPSGKPPHWVLRVPGQAPLSIPLTARGAEGLFDAFASLPGIRTEHMLKQMKAGSRIPVVIWRAGPLRNAPDRLH